MRKYLIYTFIAITFYSCNAGIKIGKGKIIPIENDFNGSFHNKSYATKGNCYTEPNILEFFNIFTQNIDTVNIQINHDKELLLFFRDSFELKTEIYKGALLRSGCYEIFLRKEKKEIPPFFPIIYSKRDIDRIRIAITTDNNLIIENKWARDGNIFLLAAGGSGRYHSYFQAIPKNK